MCSNILCSIVKSFGGCSKDIIKPDITFYEIDSKQVAAELKALNIATPLGLLDYGSPYYYTTLWGLNEAIGYIRKIYSFPKYEMPRRDCDDFAFLMKGLISAEFGISDFGFALGASPMGYHAFNIARIEDRRVLIEPQTGEIFELGERGYNPDKVTE